MTRTKFRALAAALLAVLIVSSGMVGGVSAQTIEEPNYESEMVGDHYIDEDRLDIASWNASEMDSVKMAYDDSGVAKTLPIEFNDSADAPTNQIAYRLDKVDVDDYQLFPREKEHSALDAAEWTVDDSSGGTGAVSDVTTATNVEAVEVDATSQTAGDTITATYSNFSITSDAEKRVAMVGLNVDTIGTDTEVTISFEDSDADAKELYINSSLSASGDDVIANQTGSGYFSQEKLADLPTLGSGDGEFDGIESVTVTVTDGNANVDVYALDAERKGELTLGEEKVDSDGDDELETETIQEVVTPGEIQIHSIDTLPSEFDDAVINDLGLLEVHWTSSQRGAEDNQLTISDAEAYGGYASQGEYMTRLSLYSWIDLTHHNPVLKAEQPLVSERYKAFGYIEDAGDQDFSEYDSFTDVQGSLEGEGQVATLDTTIQPGQDYVLKKLVVYQDGEVSQIKSQQSPDEGNTGFWNTGNPIANFFNWAMAGVTGLFATVLGILKFRG